MLDRALESILRGGAWLVLPVALLLFLQWPMREVIGRGSREANDLGQWLFALYMALALTAATRRGAHLATDVLSHRYPPRIRRALSQAVGVVAILPWTLFVLWFGFGIALNSVRMLERFPDTFNPGYFVIKVAAFLLAFFLLVQTVIDWVQPQLRSGARPGDGG